MSQDDPFAEPSDTDKTVIRLNPGGRVPDVAPPRPALPGHDALTSPAAPAGANTGRMPADEVPGALPGQRDPAQDNIGAPGLNPLNGAAAPLFLLVGRIRNRAQHSDPASLRQKVIAEIRTFEERALRVGVPLRRVRVARYALCATLDDVVLNTPWGGQSLWARQSMVGTFHQETHGGDRFYDLLARLQGDPAGNRDLLEFLYMCLSLGFEGRLRVDARGSERHLAIRDSLAATIRTQRPPVDPELSPRWQGVRLAHRARSLWLPFGWLVGVSTAVIALVFVGLSYRLSFDTDGVRSQLLAVDFATPVTLARPAPVAPPAPPPEPVIVIEQDRIGTFLAPEIAEGLVTVETEGNTVSLRLTGADMFRSASDELSEDFGPLIDRIATALEAEDGRIIVAGHSDNIPISTARFPSNTFLSLARARAVMARMLPVLSDDARIVAEGRADRDPVASNDTAEGRALNRRIEIIFIKAG